MPKSDLLKTPVIFLIFNRPDVTQQVFQAIRQAQPSQLLVIADGPRNHKPGEAEKCQKTRSIIEQVDWNCQVLTNYAEVNLGCQKRVSSGLDWAFNLVEEAIILEDDCLPHPDFFPFCTELLERYRQDTRILTISGTNYQLGQRRTSDSYYFSRYNHCWGWATWRRAWQYFDFEMKLWPQLVQQNWLETFLIDADLGQDAINTWHHIFASTYTGKINSWAYRWTFSCWVQSGLNIIPDVNLISNIGFEIDPTHTNQPNQFASMAVESINFPLRHPSAIIRNLAADTFTQNTLYHPPGRLARLKAKLRSMLI